MLISTLRTLLSGGSLSFSYVLAQIVSVVMIAVLVLPFHEFAHGFAALKLGDHTPKYDGRITLNPMASIDPRGALFLLLFGIGWAKPVQINPRNFRNPKRDMAISALAGPLANVIAAFVGVLIYVPLYYFAPYNTFTEFIYYFLMWYMRINLSLAVFNLIPVPPLDGSRIIAAFLSDRAMYSYYRYQNILIWVLFAVMLTGMLSGPLNTMINGLFSALVWIAERPYVLFGVI